MKHCSYDCEYITDNVYRWSCVAQKNMPTVNIGDECTAHKSKSLYKNNYTDESVPNKEITKHCLECDKFNTHCVGEYEGVSDSCDYYTKNKPSSIEEPYVSDCEHIQNPYIADFTGLSDEHRKEVEQLIQKYKIEDSKKTWLEEFINSYSIDELDNMGYCEIQKDAITEFAKELLKKPKIEYDKGNLDYRYASVIKDYLIRWIKDMEVNVDH